MQAGYSWVGLGWVGLFEKNCVGFWVGLGWAGGSVGLGALLKILGWVGSDKPTQCRTWTPGNFTGVFKPSKCDSGRFQSVQGSAKKTFALNFSLRETRPARVSSI